MVNTSFRTAGDPPAQSAPKKPATLVEVFGEGTKAILNKMLAQMNPGVAKQLGDLDTVGETDFEYEITRAKLMSVAMLFLFTTLTHSQYKEFSEIFGSEAEPKDNFAVASAVLIYKQLEPEKRAALKEWGKMWYEDPENHQTYQLNQQTFHAALDSKGDINRFREILKERTKGLKMVPAPRKEEDGDPELEDPNSPLIEVGETSEEFDEVSDAAETASQKTCTGCDAPLKMVWVEPRYCSKCGTPTS